MQLLCAQIPKVQKDTDNFTVVKLLLGSLHVEAAHEMLVKLTPDEDNEFEIKFLISFNCTEG